MAYIGNQPAEQFTSFATQEFSTSATTSYTLDHAVTNENEIALFINNVRQQPGSGKAYTATGTALTLSAATASTDTMYCVFLGRALQTVTPATNSITAAMVGNDLISGKDALTDPPADTDELLISDAGTIKRIDVSLIGGLAKVSSASGTGLSSQASIEVALPETYRAFKMYLDIKPETDNAHLQATLSVDDGSSYYTSSNNYQYGYQHIYASGTHDVIYSNGDTKIELSKDGGNNTANAEGHHVQFDIKPITTESSVNQHNRLTWEGSRNDGSGNNFRTIRGSGILAATYTNKINKIKIAYDSGNIEDYFYTLYGYLA